MNKYKYKYKNEFIIHFFKNNIHIQVYIYFYIHIYIYFSVLLFAIDDNNTKMNWYDKWNLKVSDCCESLRFFNTIPSNIKTLKSFFF